MKCFRASPKSDQPLMGELPSNRVTPTFPFTETGVDYAGPFILKDRRGRGHKKFKGYVSLFICMATKAVHLELVSELSTQGFLCALKRFISRRGKPSVIFSDNGSNFVGAVNELKALGDYLRENSDSISEKFSCLDLKWKFIPKYSPHMGGIWEAGIKAMKYHLKRVISGALLTYEDFLTVLIQVEGMLNSRPLSPLSTDPNDLNPLTPAHFLLGRSLSYIPEIDLTNEKENRLDLYQQFDCIKQHIWKRWCLEYIAELQGRQKWKTNSSKIRVGEMVLIKDKTLAPYQWPLGRVMVLHPGSDNITRVVSIRTSRGVTRRAVTGVCPLPLGQQQQ